MVELGMDGTLVGTRETEDFGLLQRAKAPVGAHHIQHTMKPCTWVTRRYAARGWVPVRWRAMHRQRSLPKDLTGLKTGVRPCQRRCAQAPSVRSHVR
jgi:hypothetical protein